MVDQNETLSPTTRARQFVNSPILERKSPDGHSPNSQRHRRIPSWPRIEDPISNQQPAQKNLPMHVAPGESVSRKPLTNDSIPRNISSTGTDHIHAITYEASYSPPRQSIMNAEHLPCITQKDVKPAMPPAHLAGITPWTNPPLYTLPGISSTGVNNSRILPAPIPLGSPLTGLLNGRPLEASSSASRQSSQGRGVSGDSYEHHSKTSIATLLRAGEQVDRDSVERHVPSGARERGRFWETE